MIHPLRATARWLVDWRTLMAIAAALVAGAVIAVVLVSGITTHDALRSRDRTSAAAARRIDRLQDALDKAKSELVAQAESNGARLGELAHEIAVLEDQIRRLGGRPIVVTTPPTRPRTTTPRPPSTSTTTTTQPPRRGTCLLVICIGGTT